MVDLVHGGMRMCIMLISVLEGLRVGVGTLFLLTMSSACRKILVVTPTLTLLIRWTSLIVSE